MKFGLLIVIFLLRTGASFSDLSPIQVNFFTELNGTIVHADMVAIGNPKPKILCSRNAERSCYTGGDVLDHVKQHDVPDPRNDLRTRHRLINERGRGALMEVFTCIASNSIKQRNKTIIFTDPKLDELVSLSLTAAVDVDDGSAVISWDHKESNLDHSFLQSLRYQVTVAPSSGTCDLQTQTLIYPAQSAKFSKLCPLNEYVVTVTLFSQSCANLNETSNLNMYLATSTPTANPAIVILALLVVMLSVTNGTTIYFWRRVNASHEISEKLMVAPNSTRESQTLEPPHGAAASAFRPQILPSIDNPLADEDADEYSSCYMAMASPSRKDIPAGLHDDKGYAAVSRIGRARGEKLRTNAQNSNSTSAAVSRQIEAVLDDDSDYAAAANVDIYATIRPQHGDRQISGMRNIVESPTEQSSYVSMKRSAPESEDHLYSNVQESTFD